MEKQSHGLGIGNGGITEYPDGTVEYRPTGKMLPAFKVAIRDVTGFSVRRVTRDDKKRLNASSMQQVLTVQGSGTTLAEVALNYGAAEKIEQWFRANPLFGQGQTAAQSDTRRPLAAAQPSATWVDELAKLASLRDSGALTADEFEQAKRKLLS